MKLPEYNVLEARQVKILKQIYELKQQVECLCVAVRLSDVNDPAEILDKLNLDITTNEVLMDYCSLWNSWIVVAFVFGALVFIGLFFFRRRFKLKSLCLLIRTVLRTLF